jgi:hypothetical protein
MVYVILESRRLSAAAGATISLPLIDFPDVSDGDALRWRTQNPLPSNSTVIDPLAPNALATE